jgi:hypothetical protein
MKPFLTIALLVIVVSIILNANKAIIPSPFKEKVGVKEIISDPADLATLGAFTGYLADKIHADSEKPEGQQEITTPYELEDMRKALADEKLFKLGKKYPKLAECLGAYLDKIPHEDVLSKEGKDRWESAFRTISEECK